MSQSIRHITETTTPLAGAATFNGPNTDVDAAPGSFSKHRAVVYSDVAGTVNMQQALDNGSGAPGNWRTTKTAPIPAGGQAVEIESLIGARWVRVQVVNGAGAEATLELSHALVAI